MSTYKKVVEKEFSEKWKLDNYFCPLFRKSKENPNWVFWDYSI